LYAFTWPVLVIAGTFLDNQVVYGSFLWMDVQLWKLWNVMRTFANYIIWFLLIFSIFTLFLWWKFEKFNPTKLLPQLVVGAILVNASWFLIWACIDLSNVLTYAVGALPLKVLKDKNSAGLTGVNITKVWVKFQSNKNNPMVVWIVDDKWNIIPFCSFNYTGGKYIVKGVSSTDKQKKDNNTKYECAYLCWKKYYKLSVGQKISRLTPDPKKKWECEWTPINSESKVDPMLNPLATIYAGLLSVWELATFNDGWAWMMLWETLFKLIFLLALVIPLLVLAVILVVRVVLIWIYIVISPFIFLFTPLKEIWGKLLGEKWNLKNVCCVIFLPVFVVFALSMSIVFLHAISFFDKKSDDNFVKNGNGFLQYLWIDKCKNSTWCVEIHPIEGNDQWVIKIHSKIKSDSSSVMVTNFSALDKFFTLLIKRIFGIGFMWIAVFTALKSCKVTEKIASSVQSFAQNMAKAAPIIPVAGGQSIGSLAQGIKSLEQLPGQKQSDQFREKIQPWINEIQRSTSGLEAKAIKEADSKASDLTKVSFAPKTVVQNISSDKEHKKLLNEKISKLLKDETSLKYLASKVGISEDELKELMKGVKKPDDLTLKDFLENYKEKIKEDLQKHSLKKFIEDVVLWKQITLLQLSDTAKDYVKQILSKVTGINISEISKNEDLAKALLKLGFSEEQVMKLLASNLEWDKIPADEKKELEKILDKIKNTEKS